MLLAKSWPSSWENLWFKIGNLESRTPAAVSWLVNGTIGVALTGNLEFEIWDVRSAVLVEPGTSGRVFCALEPGEVRGVFAELAGANQAELSG